MSGILQLGRHGLANRYLYVAMIGIGIAVTACCSALVARKAVRIGWLLWPVSVSLCVILAGLSWREVRVWRDTETLFGRTLARDPTNDLAREILYNEALRQRLWMKAQDYVVPVTGTRSHEGVAHASFVGAYFHVTPTRNKAWRTGERQSNEYRR